MDGAEFPPPDRPEGPSDEPSAARPLPNPPRPSAQQRRAGALVEVRWFEPVLIAGAVLLALLALAVGYWLGRSDSEPQTFSSSPVVTADIDPNQTTPAQSVDTTDAPDDDPTFPPAGPTTTVVAEASTTTLAIEAEPERPDEPAGATTDNDDPKANPKPPESKAVVLNGQIFLEGAVPSQQAADEIVELAAAILGEANVINNYVIDPEAGDPNLGNIRVADSVLFESGSAVIAAEFEPLLNQAVALMTIRPSVTMKVIGHTDNIGPIKLNKKLSKQRAQAVVDYIVERGIDASRFTAVGRGERRPIADNATAEGRQANRRIQVQLENLLAD